MRATYVLLLVCAVVCTRGQNVVPTTVKRVTHNLVQGGVAPVALVKPGTIKVTTPTTVSPQASCGCSACPCAVNPSASTQTTTVKPVTVSVTPLASKTAACGCTSCPCGAPSAAVPQLNAAKLTFKPQELHPAVVVSDLPSSSLPYRPSETKTSKDTVVELPPRIPEPKSSPASKSISDAVESTTSSDKPVQGSADSQELKDIEALKTQVAADKSAEQTAEEEAPDSEKEVLDKGDLVHAVLGLEQLHLAESLTHLVEKNESKTIVKALMAGLERQFREEKSLEDTEKASEAGDRRATEGAVVGTEQELEEAFKDLELISELMKDEGSNNEELANALSEYSGLAAGHEFVDQLVVDTLAKHEGATDNLNEADEDDALEKQPLVSKALVAAEAEIIAALQESNPDNPHVRAVANTLEGKEQVETELDVHIVKDTEDGKEEAVEKAVEVNEVLKEDVLEEQSTIEALIHSLSGEAQEKAKELQNLLRAQAWVDSVGEAIEAKKNPGAAAKVTARPNDEQKVDLGMKPKKNPGVAAKATAKSKDEKKVDPRKGITKSDVKTPPPATSTNASKVN